MLSILPFVPSGRAPAASGSTADAAAGPAGLQADVRASLQAAQAERRAAALSRGERQAVVPERPTGPPGEGPVPRPEPVPRPPVVPESVAPTSPPSLPVPKGHTRVYRAVSEAEYQEMMKIGKFDVPPGKPGVSPMDGKWFCDTPEGAAKFGNSNMGPGPGKFRIIEADVPNAAPGLFKYDIDRLGPSRYLPIEDLNGVKPRPIEGK